MISSKAFKKLAALTAAVALVGSFAVSASAAATVTTSTAYVSGDETKIEVNVKVTGATANSNVTYYASNGSGVFHMDQEKADNAGAAQFTQYVTDEANLDATVIVNDGAKVTDTVTANTITINGKVAETLPTEKTDYTGTVTLVADEDFAINPKDVTVEGADSATVTTTNEANKYTVAINGIDGDVVITVGQVETDVKPEATGSWIASGFAYNQDGFRQITVIGKVENLGDGVCGALVDGEKYKSESFATVSGQYANYFVVQLVDEAGNSFITDGDHTTGIYYNDTLLDNKATVTAIAQ